MTNDPYAWLDPFDRPLIYNIERDEVRPVTQADVDNLVRINTAYGRIRRAMSNEHAKAAAGCEMVNKP